MISLVWLGAMLGVGAALSIGPIFVTIISTATVRGFGASMRVITGSAMADLVLVIPALAFAWVMSAIAQATAWIGLAGACYFGYLGVAAILEALRLRQQQAPLSPGGGSWVFWRGVMANLSSPLTWTFWIATGTPTMAHARQEAGWPGLAVFTVTWFVVAMAVEAIIAFAVSRVGRSIGARFHSVLSAMSGLVFLALAAFLLARDVAPHLAA